MSNSIFNFEKNYFGQVIISPSTISKMATSLEIWNEIASFSKLLITDQYTNYLDEFYRQGISRFKNYWGYMDIINVLYTVSKIIKPKNYLEIGVRRGRSLCTVVRGCNTVNIKAFDIWIENYANMGNPGVEFVKEELKKHDFQGNIEFINGNSHQTLSEFFKLNPDIEFDLITVDGDHSEDGAFQDLCEVIPHLAIGGVIVFDDIVHPEHLYLLDVWKKVLNKFEYLKSFEYMEIGYGISFAIKKDIKETNLEIEIKKYKKYYDLLNMWNCKLNKKNYIYNYLLKNNFRNIAIYGTGEIATRLSEQIDNIDIKVHYYINKEPKNKRFLGENVIGIKDIKKSDNIDLIIVTPIYDYEEILTNLNYINSNICVMCIDELIKLL